MELWVGWESDQARLPADVETWLNGLASRLQDCVHAVTATCVLCFGGWAVGPVELRVSVCCTQCTAAKWPEAALLCCM